MLPALLTLELSISFSFVFVFNITSPEPEAAPKPTTGRVVRAVWFETLPTETGAAKLLRRKSFAGTVITLTVDGFF